jgi:hypothetical protein
MHSVFRVEQVNLILISDNDQQLHVLTEVMCEETKGSTGWFQLGKVVGEYEKAQQLYEVLFNFMKNHLRFDYRIYLLIILAW